MGDGMKRAALAALCSRGPWSVSDYEVGVGKVEREMTGDDLRAVFAAVQRGHDERGWLRLPWPGSDRRSDRALQLLRRAGLIEYAGKPKRWRVCATEPSVEGEA